MKPRIPGAIHTETAEVEIPAGTGVGGVHQAGIDDTDFTKIDDKEFS